MPHVNRVIATVRGCISRSRPSTGTPQPDAADKGAPSNVPLPDGMSDALILNVDDSEERLRYRSTVLRDVGFDVLEACTGTEALAVAARTRPALILLDVHLPDFDGFEVCARLKAMPSTRDIPVLHVSAALCEDEHWVRGLRAGAEAYLREPLDTEVLREVIRTLLRRAKTAAIAEGARREAEHALQASERRYRELVEHAPYGICQTTADGRWVAANQALVTPLRDALETQRPSTDPRQSFGARDCRTI